MPISSAYRRGSVATRIASIRIPTLQRHDQFHFDLDTDNLSNVTVRRMGACALCGFSIACVAACLRQALPVRLNAMAGNARPAHVDQPFRHRRRVLPCGAHAVAAIRRVDPDRKKSALTLNKTARRVRGYQRAGDLRIVEEPASALFRTERTSAESWFRRPAIAAWPSAIQHSFWSRACRSPLRRSPRPPVAACASAHARRPTRARPAKADP